MHRWPIGSLHISSQIWGHAHFVHTIFALDICAHSVGPVTGSAHRKIFVHIASFCKLCKLLMHICADHRAQWMLTGQACTRDSIQLLNGSFFYHLVVPSRPFVWYSENSGHSEKSDLPVPFARSFPVVMPFSHDSEHATHMTSPISDHQVNIGIDRPVRHVRADLGLGPVVPTVAVAFWGTWPRGTRPIHPASRSTHEPNCGERSA